VAPPVDLDRLNAGILLVPWMLMFAFFCARSLRTVLQLIFGHKEDVQIVCKEKCYIMNSYASSPNIRASK
jgi:hypothetical protein